MESQTKPNDKPHPQHATRTTADEISRFDNNFRRLQSTFNDGFNIFSKELKKKENHVTYSPEFRTLRIVVLFNM